MTEEIKSVGELAGLCGWDGAAWQKLNLLFGYHDRYLEEVHIEANTTSHTLQGSVVPEGEVWVVTAMCALNRDSASTLYYELTVFSNKFEHYINIINTPAKLTPVTFYGAIPMKAGDRVRAILHGVTVGDVLRFGIFGYKMKVA